MMSVLILPAALVVALFSRELLLLWTRNPVTVEHSHILLSLLVIGTTLNGLMNLPYSLQLAHGWTKLAFYTNVVAVAFLAPALVVITRHYGAVGAASIWVILNSGYVLITVQLMHRRLLPDEKWRWLRQGCVLAAGGFPGGSRLGPLVSAPSACSPTPGVVSGPGVARCYFGVPVGVSTTAQPTRPLSAWRVAQSV